MKNGNLSHLTDSRDSSNSYNKEKSSDDSFSTPGENSAPHKKKNSTKYMKTKQYDFSFKIVLIGDSGVGKSCILMRFADDKFNENFYATIGVDFRFKNLEIDGKAIKLQIWDTAGQERFKTITNAYYRGADAIIFVYDISDRNSFLHLKDWMDDVNKITANENPYKIVLGNKCDLEYKKEINENDISVFKEQSGMEIFEISAKESIKIKEVFDLITKKLITRHESKNSNTENTKSVYSLYHEDGGEIKPNTQNCC